MRFLKMLPTILSVVLLCSVVAISNNVNNKPDTSEKIMTVSNNYTEEMKGIWVTYMDLDMQSTDKSYDSFKSKFKKIISNIIHYEVIILICYGINSNKFS